MGMFRFDPSGPLARLRKVRRTRAGKNLDTVSEDISLEVDKVQIETRLTLLLRWR